MRVYIVTIILIISIIVCIGCDSTKRFISENFSNKPAEKVVEPVTLTNVYDAKHIPLDGPDEYDYMHFYYYSGRLYVSYTYNMRYIKEGMVTADYITLSFDIDGGDMKKYDASFGSLYPDYFGADYKITEQTELQDKVLALNPDLDDYIYGSIYDYNYYASTDADDEYELYISNYSGVYGIKSDGEVTYLCDWSSSSVVYSDIKQLLPINSERFACLSAEWTTGEIKMTILTCAEDIAIDQTILYTGNLNEIDPFIKTVIDRYNTVNKDVRIIVVDYHMMLKNNTSDNINDVTSSDIRYDIDINRNYEYGQSHSYTKDKVMCDLYELFDEDEELSADMLLKSALRGCEYNGKLYEIAIKANYKVDIANGDYFGGDVITLDELYAAEERAEKNGGHVFMNMNKSSVLEKILSGYLTDFVDYDNLTCRFDSEDFIALLEYCGKYPLTVSEYLMIQPNYRQKTDSSPTLYTVDFYGKPIMGCYADDYFRDGKVLYVENRPLISERTFFYIDFLFGGESRRVNISNSGKKSAFAGITVSINSKSPYKSEAWDFIKFLLSDEVQLAEMNTDYIYNDMPVTVSAMKKYLEKNIGAEELYDYATLSRYANYTTEYDVYGNPIYIYGPEEEYTKYVFGEKDADEIIAYLNEGEFAPPIDSGLLSLILEDANTFFAGGNTAETAAKIIQNRASTYVSEKYG